MKTAFEIHFSSGIRPNLLIGLNGRKLTRHHWQRRLNHRHRLLFVAVVIVPQNAHLVGKLAFLSDCLQDSAVLAPAESLFAKRHLINQISN